LSTDVSVVRLEHQRPSKAVFVAVNIGSAIVLSALVYTIYRSIHIPDESQPMLDGVPKERRF